MCGVSVPGTNSFVVGQRPPDKLLARSVTRDAFLAGCGWLVPQLRQTQAQPAPSGKRDHRTQSALGQVTLCDLYTWLSTGRPVPFLRHSAFRADTALTNCHSSAVQHHNVRRRTEAPTARVTHNAVVFQFPSPGDKLALQWKREPEIDRVANKPASQDRMAEFKKIHE